MAAGDNEEGWKEGVKLGASAFSFLPALGMGTGLVIPPVAGVTCAGASLLALADLEPDADPQLDGAETADDGEIALRSDIIFCRLDRASPPDIALCFCVAASTAASMAVRGAETGAVIFRGAEDDRGASSACFEMRLEF